MRVRHGTNSAWPGRPRPRRPADDGLDQLKSDRHGSDAELDDLHRPYPAGDAAGARPDSAIGIYWPGHGIHAAWPVLDRGEREQLASCSSGFTGSQRRERKPGAISRCRLARWPGPWHHSSAGYGSRSGVPTDLGGPAGKVPATPRPCPRCQRCMAQGPTPETRSTLMWVMYPGGGLSIGGKRISGPR
jgi:hypothetical protein